VVTLNGRGVLSLPCQLHLTITTKFYIKVRFGTTKYSVEPTDSRPAICARLQWH